MAAIILGDLLECVVPACNVSDSVAESRAKSAGVRDKLQNSHVSGTEVLIVRIGT